MRSLACAILVPAFALASGLGAQSLRSDANVNARIAERVGLEAPFAETLGVAATAIDPEQNRSCVLTADAGGNSVVTVVSTGFVQGEQITLNIFGVNAAYHDIVISKFKQNFRVSRGQLSTVTFMAKKAGIFPIICITHKPSHRADLAVFRKGSGPC